MQGNRTDGAQTPGAPDPDYLDELGAFAAGLAWKDFEPALREQVGWILADTIAAIVGGAPEPEMRALSGAQPDMPPTVAGATLIGTGRRVGVDTAALLNGTAGTFLEMDEGNRFARGHPAIHVIPALIALAESGEATAEDFVAALVAGYEVGSRLGSASRLRAAMHPHGTWGTIGAAVACARLARLDARGMREAINVASSMTTASSKRTMLEGGLVRNVYAGLSNRDGLLALRLVQAGFTGERDGPGSLFGGIVSEHFDREAAVRGIGSEWHLMQNYFKLHSCCRYNHGALDAVDAIGARGGLPAHDRIASITVTTYDLAAELDDPAPRNTLAAKFSVPFAVATRLVNGSSALPSFTWEAVRDPAVLALAAKVRVVEDPAMTRRLPLERPARVEITLDDGRSVQGEVGVNRGDDAAPYGRDELRGKFGILAGRVWPASHAGRVLDATLVLAQEAKGLRAWLDLLRAGPDTTKGAA
ncbi:MAG: MmgE/PrpD family protein [Lautropia sp.]